MVIQSMMPGHAHHGRTLSLPQPNTTSNPAAVDTDNLFSSIIAFDDIATARDENLSFDDNELMDGDDDNLDNDDEDADGDDKNPDSGNGSHKPKKGKRPASTAEKKATHNAVERARRETLNGKFLVLADMLPGMTSVKRASKAAIVNNSIDLIRELRATEAKLAKDNAALRAEVAALRKRGSNASASARPSSANRQQQQQLQAETHAQAQHQQQQQQASLLFPNMQAVQQFQQIQMQQMPPAAAAAAMAAQQANAMHMLQQIQQAQAQMHAMQQQHNSHNEGMQEAAMAAAAAAATNAATAAGLANPSAPAHQQQHRQQPVQHHTPPSSAGTAQAFEAPAHPLFPGVFAGLFNTGGAWDPSEHASALGLNGNNAVASVRSESGSPSSTHSNQALAFNANGNSSNGQGSSSIFAHDLFDMPSFMAGGDGVNGSLASPAASYNSPPGTVASFAGSELASSQFGGSTGSNPPPTTAPSSGNAPSPASSHSVPTPGNAYSPIALPALSGPALNSAGRNGNNGISAPEASFLASHFGSSDLGKAQADLHAFIAYHQQQQRGSSPAMQASSRNFAGAPAAALYGSGSSGAGAGAGQSAGGMPAQWQMMMAQAHAAQQHQAMMAAAAASFGGGHASLPSPLF